MTELFEIIWPIAVVALYYMVVWLLWGRDPLAGTVVTRYDPPRGMSAGLMRYCWKQRFDERVVWAGLAGLVRRGLADFETREDGTYIRPVWPPEKKAALPKEEAVLYSDLATAKGRRGVRLAMTDESMSRMTVRMAESLNGQERGRWFVENRKTVLLGTVLSGAALLLAVDPSNDQFYSLLVSAPLIAVSTFYLYLLTQRIAELVRVAGEHFTKAVAGRLATMLVLALSCVAGIWIASIVMYANMGWSVLEVVASLTLINLLFLYLMKAPTREGRKLLDEIEGFRHFLQMVEHLPMDRPEAPGPKRGLYEAYLPYALALEVEQQWCDQIAAIASSTRQYEELEKASVFHLGMWDGRPVDVAFRMEPK
jgi:hypothetical protein